MNDNDTWDAREQAAQANNRNDAQFRSEEGAQQDSTDFGKATNVGLDSIDKPVRKDIPGALMVAPGDADVPYLTDSGTLAYVEITREESSRTFSARTVYALVSTTVGFPGDPVMLAARDSARARLLVKNVGSGVVRLGGLNDIQSDNGFLLAAGQQLDTEVQGAVYAAVPSDGTESTSVSVWIETDS